MKRYAWLPLTAALVSCNKVGFDAVSIRPIYSYVDGCGSVKISGTGFTTATTAVVSMLDAAEVEVTAPITDIIQAVDDPALDAEAEVASTDADGVVDQNQKAATLQRFKDLNAGYYILGTMPAAPAASNGYASILVTQGDTTITLEEAYYYVACPGAPYVESYGPGSAAAGSEVSLGGCGIDPATMSVQLLDSAGAPAGSVATLSSDCGAASAHFTLPTVADGEYYITVVDADGVILAGDPCGLQDSATYYCTDYPITVGGAK